MIELTINQNDYNIVVKQIIRDIQTNEVWFELETKYLGKTVEYKITRNNLSVTGLRDLRFVGFPFLTKDEAEDWISFVIENETLFPQKDVFQKVGWHSIENEKYFLHRKAMCNGEIHPFFYEGDIDLSANGSFEKQIIFFNETVVKSIGLQTICAVSLASTIVGMVVGKDLKFIFHIEGASTSGKTTSLMLAGSMWGNPKISPNGVIKNWNTTGNKLIQSAGGNKGVLIGLDELSMSNADNTQLTYLLTGGADKQRMTSDDGADKEFRTIFMSTGEIQFKTTNFGGIGVRLFEVKNYNFTGDKETADMILQSIQENYGHIGFRFAKNLTEYSEEYIQSKVEAMTEKVIKRIEYHVEKQGKAFSPLFSRMAEKIATIAIAASFAKAKLGMNFDTKVIVDFLICETTLLENGQEQAVQAIEKFFEEYSKNQTKFPKTIDNKVVNVWGKSVFKHGELTEIIVLYNQFITIMKKIGFPDTTSLIKSLKEKDFIKCEEGKNYTRRNIGDNKRAKAIVIDVLEVNGGVDYEV